MKPIIEVRSLIARYGEKTILHNIDVDFYSGQITVILGASGCGKTTLLKNILRLEQPYRGSVKILGEEVTALDENEYENILKKIGMLFQNGALLNSVDIFENLCIPFEQHTKLPMELIEKMIKVKLNLVNMLHAIHLLPSELSGGMKKRAALARAIALDPEILFCDEPSAGLDPITSASLDELLLSLKQKFGMSIVVVTHELASISRIADRIIFLNKGVLLYEGTLTAAKKANIKEIDEFFAAGRVD